jgi:nucleoid-associated protein YgaU
LDVGYRIDAIYYADAYSNDYADVHSNTDAYADTRLHRYADAYNDDDLDANGHSNSYSIRRCFSNADANSYANHYTITDSDIYWNISHVVYGSGLFWACIFDRAGCTKLCISF